MTLPRLGDWWFGSGQECQQREGNVSQASEAGETNGWSTGVPEPRVDTAGHSGNGGGNVVAGILAPVTVILAGGQSTTRFGVRSVLERFGGIAVVGEVGTADQAVAVAARYRPDVLMIDIDTREPSAVGVIRQVARATPATGVLVFSAVDNDMAIIAAIHAGALGYLLKSADSGELLRTVHAVAAGDVIVGRAIAGRFGAALRPADRNDSYPFPQLTNRERDVLERIAAGKSNSVIARELALSPKTISNRISSVFSKLRVANRAQVIVLAREAGLGYS
jgi:DNA-binding NarL/FixJ family response regulator